MMSKELCQKDNWNGCCCCNCANHLEDFHHCDVSRPEGIEGCVCNIHKGWICRVQFEDTKEIRYHSGWSEHGMCEMHVLKKTI